jgi:predicted Zn-dependent protease
MKLFTKQALSYTVLTLLLLSQASHAEPGMSDQQIQQMMQQAEEAKKCFSKLDQSKFDELETRGKEMEAKIKALCTAGQRDEAMSSAMKFSKQMQDDPQIKALRECSKLMEGSMAEMELPYMQTEEDEQEESGHVCDDM